MLPQQMYLFLVTSGKRKVRKHGYEYIRHLPEILRSIFAVSHFIVLLEKIGGNSQ